MAQLTSSPPNMSNVHEADPSVASAPPLNVMEIFVNSKFKRPAMANMMLYEGKSLNKKERGCFFGILLVYYFGKFPKYLGCSTRCTLAYQRRVFYPILQAVVKKAQSEVFFSPNFIQLLDQECDIKLQPTRLLRKIMWIRNFLMQFLIILYLSPNLLDVI